jgi:hypothetical protein
MFIIDDISPKEFLEQLWVSLSKGLVVGMLKFKLYNYCTCVGMFKVDDISPKEFLEPLRVSLSTGLEQAVTLELCAQLLLQLTTRRHICETKRKKESSYSAQNL